MAIKIKDRAGCEIEFSFEIEVDPVLRSVISVGVDDQREFACIHFPLLEEARSAHAQFGAVIARAERVLQQRRATMAALGGEVR